MLFCVCVCATAQWRHHACAGSGGGGLAPIMPPSPLSKLSKGFYLFYVIGYRLPGLNRKPSEASYEHNNICKKQLWCNLLAVMFPHSGWHRYIDSPGVFSPPGCFRSWVRTQNIQVVENVGPELPFLFKLHESWSVDSH